MKKLIITGSSGAVGTSVCEKLIRDGYELICTDIKENSNNKEIDKITVKIDLRNKAEIVNQLPHDVDGIIHLAANVRVPQSIKDPSLAKDNLDMTFNLLEFTRETKIQNFLFASSKDVYGNFKSFYSEEDVHIEACESPYAASKIGCESLVYAYHKCFGINFLIFRISSVYGRYDEFDRLIPIFIRRTKENKDIVVNGANKLLDFVHIDDLADGLTLCLEKFEEVKNRSFNIAYGEGTTLIKIAELVKNYLGGSNNIITGESNPGDVVKSISDITKARKAFGYRPKIKIEEGIKRTIEKCEQS